MRVCQPVAVSARSGIVVSGQVVEMPAQVVAQCGALGDQAFAVTDEQANIELRSGELRDGQRVETFA